LNTEIFVAFPLDYKNVLDQSINHFVFGNKMVTIF